MINFLIKKFIKDYDNYSNARVRNAYGSFCGVIGIILNVFLSAIKFIVGLMTSSIAVMADSINNLSDAGSSIISL
ncbi:MAG: cation transporter, partial [Oscillospiraceae bacterium]